MLYRFKTNEFDVQFVESEIDQPVLWESHCHAQYELIAVIEGDITIMLEGKSYRLKENQLIILPPLLYHSVTANEKGSYRRITALFGAEMIPAVLQDAFSKQERHAALPAAQTEKIRQTCRMKDRDYYAPFMHSLMIEIFYDALHSPSSPVKIETDAFLQTALRYIDEHLHEKILLDDLAKATARSKSSFCHLFEQKMKIAPKQYILRKKLAMASKLISEGMPHTLAALKVGYENYSNFYRMYQKSLEKEKS